MRVSMRPLQPVRGHRDMTLYTIRYRCRDGRGEGALIVTDGDGTAFLFNRGQLQLQLTGHDACARLCRVLERCVDVAVLPEVPPYTLDELRRLATPAPRPRGAGRGRGAGKGDGDVAQ